MKFSFEWLKTWVKTELDANQLAHLLTMSGLEVEEITKVAPEFSKVIIAQVITIKKHPNADRLNITQVDIGKDKPIQIVCGATNVKPGIKVPCALPGAILPGDFKIKPTIMRGENSDGMLCSAQELGLPETEGLMILPDNAPIGVNIRDYLHLDDDILEIKSTPNRADCLSIKGIAREVVALTNAPFTPIEICGCQEDKTITFPTSIQSPDACGKLITRVIKNVNPNIGTPLWMQERLERSGIRSINFLVDVGNYVMLELGQPLHIFDLDKLQNKLIARFATSDEELLCLNDKQVSLDEKTLVIADDSAPLSIAGLMGGKNSSVSGKTNNILIESAFFYPDVIAGKSRQYGFSSESSFRFERGVDYQLQEDSINRATELILSLAGGQAGTLNIANGNLPDSRQISVRKTRAEKLLGITLDNQQIQVGLRQLGLNPIPQKDGFIVTSPSFRFDINIEVDIIEEIARLYGYENIKPKVTSGKLLMLKQADCCLNKEQIFDKISHLGYQEVVNYSFVDETWEIDFANNTTPIRIINPIASQMNVMRSTLIGSLINNLIANLNRKQSRIRLFELAKIFKKNGSDLIQQDYIAALAYGYSLPEQWGISYQKVDFFDVKNDLMQILNNISVTFVASNIPGLHPGKSANILRDDQSVIGSIGELHPRLVQKYDLPSAPIVFELAYDAISQPHKIRCSPISKYQPVHRDLAFIVPENVTAQELLSTLNSTKIPALKSVKIFDLYRGGNIPHNHKGLAIKIIFQDNEKTLKDHEIDKLMQILINQVKPLGVNLR
ncbi:MAG: phenylalanine--tRNA ligase subunit beta [Neisseriaceae bacterium]|nr:MAG: phenylalanine--tRNA ligase subunit beta [Neisseriaceae bacterium]